MVIEIFRLSKGVQAYAIILEKQKNLASLGD
jgi:hypothetical protein